MEKYDRHLTGSMNALLVLEAAVRYGNFSVAGRRLNLSQPAVSRHISVLEERLGQSLFHRNNNRITPTANARELAAAVALGLGHIGETWKRIYCPPPRDDVILACTFGFADQWLMPRFARLRRAMDGDRVRVLTTEQVDVIDPTSVDAAVVCDLGDRSDRSAFPLIPEEAFPVCSPAFALQELGAAHGYTWDPVVFRNLPQDKFLHFDQTDNGFLTWDSWFSKVGLVPPAFARRETFDAYPFMLQAVLDGEGIALGWRGLVDELVAQGRLLRVGPIVANRETAYYLQHRSVENSDGALARLVAWFRLEGTCRQGTN